MSCGSFINYYICYLGWIQGVEIIRGSRGLNLIGCDLVEVSPPYDTTGIYFAYYYCCLFCYCVFKSVLNIDNLFYLTGTTALTGANLLFEMLCVLPGVKYM